MSFSFSYGHKKSGADLERHMAKDEMEQITEDRWGELLGGEKASYSDMLHENFLVSGD